MKTDCAALRQSKTNPATAGSTTNTIASDDDENNDHDDGDNDPPDAELPQQRPSRPDRATATCSEPIRTEKKGGLHADRRRGTVRLGRDPRETTWLRLGRFGHAPRTSPATMCPDRRFGGGLEGYKWRGLCGMRRVSPVGMRRVSPCRYAPGSSPPMRHLSQKNKLRLGPVKRVPVNATED